jgi:hypothetical protein
VKEILELLKLLLLQLELLSSDIYFDPNARFIFVVTAYYRQTAGLLYLLVYHLWLIFRIVNFIVIIPRPDSNRRDANEDVYELLETKNFDIYSWFPYEGNNCAGEFRAVLIDQCGSEDVDGSLHNVSLFPNKIPRKFAGCSTTAYVSLVNPYAMLTDNYTGSDGRTVHRFEGVDVAYLTLVTEALNLTLNFAVCGKKCEGEGIVVYIGFKPLNSVGTEHGDATIPYAFSVFRWFVPCPKSGLKMERILSVFDSSVWFTMLPVIVLTALLFWSAAKFSLGTVMKESYGYRTVLHCLYNAWCVFMSVSVPEMPRTYRVRAVFCLFVWYSFAMSTIFQSFFTSYLVSPGYLPRISSFDDLIDSGLKYGSNHDVDDFLRQAEYVEHDKLNLDRFECPDLEECLEHVFTESDITFVAATFQAQYTASRFDKIHDENMLCSLDENIFSSNCVMILHKGNPVIDRFNFIIRHCIEAGLGDKYWSDIKFSLKLQNMGKSEESDCQACDDMYFVFSLTHLKVVFLVLGFGHVLSVTVFVAELICKWLSKCGTLAVKRQKAASFSFLH